MQVILQENGKKISNELYGIFLEDINFSVDGGLNANMVNNYSFDGRYQGKHFKQKDDFLRYWVPVNVDLESKLEGGISSESHYAVISVNGKGTIYNLGYNGGGEYSDRCAMSIKAEENYVFSCYIKSLGYTGRIKVSMYDDDDLTTSKASEISVTKDWTEFKTIIAGTETQLSKLVIAFEGKGKIALDLVQLYNEDYWGHGDAKWQNGKFRKDLVRALYELHPAFMRFPGGCIVEGTLPGNEYNWKETVGKLQNRKQKYNLWAWQVKDRGYSQSYQIGFYEYFCLCEDLGCKPQPTLSAGLNCQMRSILRGELVCPNVPINSKEFKSYIIDNYLDLIEFANGEKGTSKWADLRCEMGHEKPFGLERIGIGNENFGKTYFRRFKIIERAIHEKYPQIKCIHCGDVGLIKNNPDKVRNIVGEYENTVIDEHCYKSAEWFVKNRHKFDHIDAKLNGNKIYLGEYAANMMPRHDGGSENANKWRSAIGEAVFLVSLERNADVVTMTSYAPLFNLKGGTQWQHNLIEFNPSNYVETTNYKIQKLFRRYYGDIYVDFDGDLPKDVYMSATENDNCLFVKIVNYSNYTKQFELNTTRSGRIKSAIVLSGAPRDKNYLGYYGTAAMSITEQSVMIKYNNSILSYKLAPKSVYFVEIDKKSIVGGENE